MILRSQSLSFLIVLGAVSFGCDTGSIGAPSDALLVADELDELSTETSPSQSSSALASFEVEMHNNTTGQWFSPCLCAIHHPSIRLFREGRAATTGAATFSEDGFNGVLAEELRQKAGVYSVLQCEAGLTAPGESRVESIEGPKWGRLTCAAMPVTTNDVLTVAQRDRLPKWVGSVKTHDSVEWDLGSEEDNYSPDFIPLDSLVLDNGAPSVLSFFTRAFATDGVVTAEGTMEVFDEYVGSDDFPADEYGWTGPASTWTVTRTQ